MDNTFGTTFILGKLTVTKDTKMKSVIMSGSLTTPEIRLGDSNSIITQKSSLGSMKIQTPTGYITIGSENSSYAHISTDRGSFWFDSVIIGASDILARHDLYTHGHLYLNSDNTNADSIVYFGDDTDDTTHNLKYNNTIEKFQFSHDLVVEGDLFTRIGNLEVSVSDLSVRLDVNIDSYDLGYDSESHIFTFTIGSGGLCDAVGDVGHGNGTTKIDWTIDSVSQSSFYLSDLDPGGTVQTGSGSTPNYDITVNASGVHGEGAGDTETVTVVNLLEEFYHGGNLTTSQVAATSLTLTESGDHITINFAKATDADHYEIYSSIGVTNSYGLLAKVFDTDFTGNVVVYDDTYNRNTTIYYRIYAVKNGYRSTALTGSKLATTAVADVSNLRVQNGVGVFNLTFDIPSDRRFTGVNIYVDYETTTGALSKPGSPIFSGVTDTFVYEVPPAYLDYYHKFWIDTATRT